MRPLFSRARRNRNNSVASTNNRQSERRSEEVTEGEGRSVVLLLSARPSLPGCISRGVRFVKPLQHTLFFFRSSNSLPVFVPMRNIYVYIFLRSNNTDIDIACEYNFTHIYNILSLHTNISISYCAFLYLFVFFMTNLVRSNNIIE